MTYSAEPGTAGGGVEPGPWAATLLSLLLTWPLAQADEGPAPGEMKQLLERMSQAQRTLSYSGTFVYLRDGHLEALSISHQVRGDQEEERLVSLSGTLREVHRDQSGVTCVLPEVRAVSVATRDPEIRPWPVLDLDLERLAGHYQLQSLGQSRVAGRGVRVIGMVPKDGFRYGHRFYLDEDTGLPLKTDLMDQDARPIEQIMFTSLDLNPAPPTGPQGPVQREGFRQVLRPAPKTQGTGDPPDWRFDPAPPGFRLQLHNHWTDPDGKDMEHFVLSDGLASLSVYVERGVSEGLQGGAHVGAVHAWGQQVAGHQVTAVGEVPEPTVRGVIEGLRYGRP